MYRRFGGEDQMCTDKENTRPVEFKLSVPSTGSADMAVHKACITISFGPGVSPRCARPKLTLWHHPVAHLALARLQLLFQRSALPLTVPPEHLEL